MSNTGSAAPTRIVRSITGSGAFPRFSKIGNEPIPVLDAAKMGNEKRNSIGNEPIPVLDAAKMGNEKRNSIGNEPIPVLDAAKIGNPWFNPYLSMTASGHDQNRFWS